MAYFLISVSNKENLELCIKHRLAGFTNSINGAWTFSELQKGDFISFLYGAKAFNLYKVKSKIAIKDAEGIPPWKPITFKMSGKTYFFPFRINLKLIRKFEESLVRPEFAYVAENLLLRGGYRKTHFQADQTTLQNASQMGVLFNENPLKLKTVSYQSFEPLFTKIKNQISIPKVFPFQEIILQSVIRQHLSKTKHLDNFLSELNIDPIQVGKLEVLSEKVLMEGHIDILIKDAIPIGKARKIVIEVKPGRATIADVSQAVDYLKELGSEAIAGVLVAKTFSKRTLVEAKKHKIIPFEYSFLDIELTRDLASFEELRENLILSKI